MSEILLCRQPLSAKQLHHQCGIDIDQISAIRCTNPTATAANTPYLVGLQPSANDQSILRQLSPQPVARQLTDLPLTYGGDNLIALAEINAKFRDYNIGLVGASTSTYAHRIGGFVGAVQDYQNALLVYRQAATSNSAMKAAAKQRAHAAFQAMQRQFHHELNAVTAHTKSRRGTPLTHAERATNIAASSRHTTKLHVTNQIQAHNLVKLSQHAKILGNGVTVIDFSSRIGNIHTSYQSGGNWEREMFIESSSFAASAIAGTIAVNAGTAALTFLMVATPVGWVGLIIGGTAVAVSAASASLWVNGKVKHNSGDWYDAIMKWVGLK